MPVDQQNSREKCWFTSKICIMTADIRTSIVFYPLMFYLTDPELPRISLSLEL
jgi:hypothetical protein